MRFHEIQYVHSFEAAHRLLNHPGKCRHLHGHSYKAIITLESEQLDKNGMVMDFADVKKRIGEWIDAQWDHNIVLHNDDPLAKLWYDAGNTSIPQLGADQSQAIFQNKMPYMLSDNPTAEIMAKYLFLIICELIQKVPFVSVTSVVIRETEKCSASYRERR